MTGKHLFDTTVTVQHIQDVPFNRGYLFAKLKLKNGKFNAQTPTRQIVSHKVDWHETFELQCSIKTDNGRLQDKILRIYVKKETNGGKDSEKLGYCDINLGERAAYSAPCQGRYLLKVNKKSRAAAGNSIVVVTTSMVLVMGDPIFKTVENTQIKTLTGTEKDTIQGIGLTNLPESGSDSSDGGSLNSAALSKSPAHSMDCVPTQASELSVTDPNYTTQSLDRRWRGKPTALLKNLRTKSYSGSISSISDSLKTDSGHKGSKVKLNGIDTDEATTYKHTAQRRQDSGLGCSAEEHIDG